MARSYLLLWCTPSLIISDDAIQKYTIDSVNQFLEKRKNPNECP